MWKKPGSRSRRAESPRSAYARAANCEVGAQVSAKSGIFLRHGRRTNEATGAETRDSPHCSLPGLRCRLLEAVRGRDSKRESRLSRLRLRRLGQDVRLDHRPVIAAPLRRGSPAERCGNDGSVIEADVLTRPT